MRKLIDIVQQTDLTYAQMMNKVGEETAAFSAKMRELYNSFNDNSPLTSNDLSGVTYRNDNPLTGIHVNRLSQFNTVEEILNPSMDPFKAEELMLKRIVFNSKLTVKEQINSITKIYNFAESEAVKIRDVILAQESIISHSYAKLLYNTSRVKTTQANYWMFNHNSQGHQGVDTNFNNRKDDGTAIAGANLYNVAGGTIESIKVGSSPTNGDRLSYVIIKTIDPFSNSDLYIKYLHLEVNPNLSESNIIRPGDFIGIQSARGEGGYHTHLEMSNTTVLPQTLGSSNSINPTNYLEYFIKTHTNSYENINPDDYTWADQSDAQWRSMNNLPSSQNE